MVLVPHIFIFVNANSREFARIRANEREPCELVRFVFALRGEGP